MTRRPTLGRSTQGVCSRTRARHDGGHLFSQSQGARHMQQSNNANARGAFAGLSLIVAGLAIAFSGSARAQAPSPTLPTTGTLAVPTYESAGRYWQSPGGSNGCDVRYRASGESAWKPGLALWYDARDGQCRGSLVNLQPDTWYQVELGLAGQSPS